MCCATLAERPNALKIGYPRVHGYLTNSGEDISRLCCLDTHGQRDLQVQPSTIDVGLDFMALERGVSSGLCKQRPGVAAANSNVM